MAKTMSVAAQGADLLDEFNEEFQKKVEEAGETTAKECAAKLRNTSPRRSGNYAKSWRYKKEGNGYIVYNAKHYQLTHLLENGHVVRNKYGTYGRVSGIKHIEPVEQFGINEFQIRITKGMS